jgi:limonene-1,2-epoxide hydrolase
MAAIIHAARKRRQGKGKAQQAQQVAAWDSSEEAEEPEDEPPTVWGALPAAETFLKSGWLEKKTIDFGWNRVFVAVTSREVLFSVDENSFVCDRIVLSEIEKVAAHTSLQSFKVTPRNGEADCSATRDDEGQDTISRLSSQNAIAKNSIAPPSMKNILLLQSATKPAPQKVKSSTGAHFLKALSQDEKEDCVLEIFTKDGGFNDGRIFAVRGANHDEALSWTQTIQDLAQQEVARMKAANEKSSFEKVQNSARSTYEHSVVQMGSALLVGINFVIMALQYEMMPSKNTQEPDVKRAFDGVEYAFTVLFLMELCLNMLAHWFKEFWGDVGNIMDFVVVLISVLSIFLDDLPGLRCFVCVFCVCE